MSAAYHAQSLTCCSTQPSSSSPPCREQLLSRVAEGSFNVPGMTAVTKRVYASPVTTSVNLERPDARAGIGSTRPCYPNLCFAVENFDDTFSDQVCVPCPPCDPAI